VQATSFRSACFLNSTPYTELALYASNFHPVDVQTDRRSMTSTSTINRTNRKRRSALRANTMGREENWDTYILQNTEVTDLHMFIQLCKSDNNIYIVSDGGVYESQGTFGVVISDKASPVSINYGKLYSPNLYKSSYRSKAYGVLARLQTLKKSLQIHDIKLSKGKIIILFCDNKSLVKRINECRCTSITVNQHCYADINLEMQLIQEIKDMTSNDCHISV
jgi:hypothetical protein